MAKRVFELPGWLSWLGSIVLAAAAYLRGREDEQQRQQKETEELKDHYDQIADDGRNVDDAFDDLRKRAARPDDAEAGGKGVH